MQNQPLVSVITITRNRGKLLGRCIKSVLGQTYHNIEHIVVDGASTDETDDVISSFNDDRLRFVKLNSNWSIAKTINYGVEISKGKYITFLDSDDEYKPEKVEKQLFKMQSLPEEYGMVYCWMTYYDQVTRKVLRKHQPTVKGDVSIDVVAEPVVSGTPTYFFRRNAFAETGGWKEKDEIGIVSDWELAARFCQKWKVDYVPESLINVYVNHGAERMSDKTYYKDLLKRQIQFEHYFLSEFKDVFESEPSKACNHWFTLSKAYMLRGEYKKAWPYFMKLMRYRHSLRDLSLIPYCLIHKSK